MAQLRTVLLAIFVLILIGCANSPIRQNAEPITQIEQTAVPTAAPTDAAVAIEVLPSSEKLPVDELVQAGELDAIASVEPADGLAQAQTSTPSQPAVEATVGQVEIESPGRAEPPRPASVTDPKVQINYFRFASQLKKPSEPALIEWNVEGVTSVQITRFGGKYGEAGEQWTVPSAGTMEHTFPATTAGFEVTYLLTSNENQAVADQFNLTVPCEYSWAIDFRDPSLLCPGKPQMSEAAFQVFEGGVMLWLQSSGTVMYSSWDGSISAEVPDTFEHGVDAVIESEFAAPAGYYQPDYGLGKVWRNTPEARIVLGWAIAPAQGYQALRQGEPQVPFGDIDELVSLPADGYLHKQSDDKWNVQFNMPEISLARVRPPVSEASIPTPESEPIETSGVTVNYFRFNPPPSNPNDTVTLEWDVSGVNSINITRKGGDQGEANDSYTNLPAQGSIEQSFPMETAGLPVLYTLSSSEAEAVSIDFVITIPCENQWVIVDAYGDGCPTFPVISFGAQQDFENGFMLWIEEQGIIVYSNWDGTEHGITPDTYTHGIDMVSDPGLTPPSGMYQPDYGFGKVWRTVPGVRDVLGWGITQTRDYEVRHQMSDTSVEDYVEFITMASGGHVIIEHPEETWIIKDQ